jgi:CDP-diglyceride synthetase
MIAQVNTRTIDLIVIISANIFNLLIVGIMLSRPFGYERLERICGILSISLILPLGVAVAYNIANRREWWSYVLPLVLIAFLLLELLLDYILHYPFRQTRLLWPYLLLFYGGAMFMIGYSFLSIEKLGYLTLITYFLNLLATWYSYTHVGY